MNIVELGRNGKAEPGIGNAVAGETAVAGEAGEQRAVAQVLPLRAAIRTLAAAMPEPWYADAAADGKAVIAGTQRSDAPDDLMTRHDRQRPADVPIGDVQIGGHTPHALTATRISS